VLDAQGAPLSGEEANFRVLTSPSGTFTAEQDAGDFATQNQFYAILNAFSWLNLDGLKGGRWDSLNDGKAGRPASDFPAGQYTPRLILVTNGPSTACSPGEGGSQPACASNTAAPGPALDIPPHTPPDGGIPEPYGLVITKSAVRNNTMFHEFGHIADSFSYAHVLGNGVVGSGCDADGNCVPSCVLDTPDESEPLAETVADVMELYLIDRFYPLIAYEECSTLNLVSGSGGVDVHHPACLDSANDVEQFSDTRPDAPGYIESPPSSGIFEPTGKCGISEGYRQDAVYQAWWKFSHGLECSTEAPFQCDADDALASPETYADVGIAAYLYALEQSNAQSYKMFFSNMALFLDCTVGSNVGGLFRRNFAQHGIIEDGGPPLQCPAICGNGILESEADESCDPGTFAGWMEVLGGATCQSQGFPSGGDLACTNACTFDTTNCFQCGNGVREGDEMCDGADLGGQSCQNLDFTGGVLACTESCTFDTSQCTEDLPDDGTGTEVGGLCLAVGTNPDGTQVGGISTDDRVLHRGSHPDGDASPLLYCIDDPDITGFDELVCSGPSETCADCDSDSGPAPGCECDPNVADSCGAGDLVCIPATGYGAGSSFSTGRCWPADDGIPIWECQADCSTIYGETGYCHHGALPWEGAGTPICADALCEVGGVACAEEGLYCDPDSGDCVVECNGPIHDPDSGLFSCEGRGYPSEFACNLDSQRCFIDGVVHP
jgi:hypothetical protein